MILHSEYAMLQLHSMWLNHSHLLLSIGSQLTAHVDFLRLTLKTFMGNYTAIAILSGFI